MTIYGFIHEPSASDGARWEIQAQVGVGALAGYRENDKIYTFMIDTGADSTVLGPSIVSDLGIKQEDTLPWGKSKAFHGEEVEMRAIPGLLSFEHESTLWQHALPLNIQWKTDFLMMFQMVAESKDYPLGGEYGNDSLLGQDVLFELMRQRNPRVALWRDRRAARPRRIVFPTRPNLVVRFAQKYPLEPYPIDLLPIPYSLGKMVGAPSISQLRSRVLRHLESP